MRYSGGGVGVVEAKIYGYKDFARIRGCMDTFTLYTHPKREVTFCKRAYVAHDA